MIHTERIEHMRTEHQAPPMVLGQDPEVLWEIHRLDHEHRPALTHPYQDDER